MSAPLASFAGENGVRVEVRDETRPYAYADLFHLRLRVSAEVPGDAEPYERSIERLGVPASALDAARADLLAAFQRHSLPYLLRPDFPGRWAGRHRRSRPVVVPFPGAR